MNHFTQKPYLFFLISVPILLFIGILNGDALLDINVHDTYFIISYFHLTILISFLFGIIGIAYWIMKKINIELSRWLNRVHLGLTFGGILAIWVLSHFYRTELMEYQFNNNLTSTIIAIILVIVLGQIIFLLNTIRGIIKKYIISHN